MARSPLKVKSVPLSSERENLNIDSHDSGNVCCKQVPSKMQTHLRIKIALLGSPHPPPAALQFNQKNCKLSCLNVGSINSRL